VVKITKTQIVVKNSRGKEERFRKDGSLIGGGGLYMSSIKICPYTDELREKKRRSEATEQLKRLSDELATAIRREKRDFDKIPIEKIESLVIELGVIIGVSKGLKS
jgi:hypothetical protein